MSARRWILCLDGTWNSAYVRRKRDDGHEVLKPSNVLKLGRSVRPVDAAGRPQVVVYDPGVGTLSRHPGASNRLLSVADRALGGAFGAGFEANVEEALTFLVHNQLPGDEVLLFGFSRGAATARAVTRFLDWSGGLPVKADAYYLPRFFREYVLAHGQRTAEEVRSAIDAARAGGSGRRPLAPFQRVEVTFLGVWDTVMALGSRFRSAGERTSTPSRSFHVGARPAACVRHARQALAVDEARYDFRPEIWIDHHPDQTLEQRWFAGVHSNVGGGYVDDGLANVAFHWILEGAVAQGLEVDQAFANAYPRYPHDRLYRSESLLYRVLDGGRLRYGRGRRRLVGWPATAHLSLSPSVIHRLQADPDARKDDGQLRHPDLRTRYRPPNVLRYLAAQPDLDAFLQQLGFADGARALPDDVPARIAELRAGRSDALHPGDR
ncbi:MAG TPA: DUF2235 domain-containing protein [Thermoanaerobaculia bacterium]|nr:DUF2235 domain-containing protein [Thermoanaerobaculia bacterium]